MKESNIAIDIHWEGGMIIGYNIRYSTRDNTVARCKTTARVSVKNWENWCYYMPDWISGVVF